MTEERDNNGEVLTTDPLVLGDLKPFGIGGRRLCFSHPYDTGKCVKVLRQDKGRTIRYKKRRILPAWLHSAYDNNRHEEMVLNRLYRTIGPTMGEHLPICYGTVCTDLGPGLVLDLVRDHDDQISRTLRELITLGHELSEFRAAFQQLGQFLVQHVILTRNLLDHNIVVRYAGDGSTKMFIIDGLGDPAWLPLGSWFKRVGKAKVNKRLRQAWPRFESFAAKGGVTPEMIEKSNWGQGILKHRK